MIADAPLQLTCVLVGTGIVISSLEYLAAAELFDANGLLSWKVLGRRSAAPTDRWVDAIFDDGFAGVVGLRAAAGATLCLAPHPNVTLVALAIALLTSILIGYRNVAGGDGSDQMTNIVLAGLLIAALPLSDSARAAGVALIAGQSMLSYVTAGIAKAVSPVWRNGAAAILVFRTATYGSHRFARWLTRHPLASAAMCWGVILFEVTFPLAVFLPAPWLFAAFAAGFFFHAANAWLMGLNVFTWAFVATYPSLFVVATWLRTSANG